MASSVVGADALAVVGRGRPMASSIEASAPPRCWPQLQRRVLEVGPSRAGDQEVRVGVHLLGRVAAGPVDVGEREPHLGVQRLATAETSRADPVSPASARWICEVGGGELGGRVVAVAEAGRTPQRASHLVARLLGGLVPAAARPRSRSRPRPAHVAHLLRVEPAHLRALVGRPGRPGPRRPGSPSASRTVDRETPSDSASATSRSGVPGSSSPSNSDRRSSSATRSTVETARGGARTPALGLAAGCVS